MDIKRGQVWWVRDANSIGAEEAMGRPAVIVSSDNASEKLDIVNMAYITTNAKFGKSCVKTYFNSGNRWIMCNQLVTVDKKRLTKYVISLTSEVMSRVDDAIRYSLGLEEVKMVEPVIVVDESELRVECDLYKRLYEKTLEMLTERKLKEDLPEQKDQPSVAVATEVAAEEEEDEEVELPPIGPVNLNTCSEEDLRNLGFKPNIVQNIIAFRPFKKKDDLRVVPGVTKTAWLIVQHKVEVGAVEEKPKVEEKPAKVEEKPVVVHEVPAEPEGDKVNVNTATARELMNLGIGYTAAYSITGYRNKHGRYLCVEDLRNVKQFSKKLFDKLSDKLCV